MKKAIVVSLMLMFSGCVSLKSNEPDQVQHVVLLWFKADVSESDIAEVARST